MALLEDQTVPGQFETEVQTPSQLRLQGPKLPEWFGPLPEGLAESYAFEMAMIQEGNFRVPIGGLAHQEAVALQEVIIKRDHLHKTKAVTSFCGKLTARLAGVAAGSIMTLSTFGTVHEHVGPATVDATVTVDLGGDVVATTSAGSAKFDNSDGPFGIHVNVVGIDKHAVDELKQQLDSNAEKGNKPAEVLSKFEPQVGNLRSQASQRARYALMGGGIGGELVAEASIGFLLMLRRREILGGRQLALMGLSAVALPATVLGASGALTAYTAHKDALQHPRFNSSESLESIVNTANSTISSLDKYKQDSAQFTPWLNNLIAIQENLYTAPSVNGLLPMVIISDRHSRPCTYQRVGNFVDSTHAVLVLNLGDEEEWGKSFEDDLFADPSCPNDNMGQLHASVLFEPGNHDSGTTVDKIRQYANVTIMDGHTKTLSLATPYGNVQLKVLGAPDPRFTPDFADRPTLEAENQLLEQQGLSLARTAAQDRPDFVMVHDPAVGRAMRTALQELAPGYMPLLLDGHTHRYNLDPANYEVTSGSVGASGLRGYEQAGTEERSAMDMAVGYFDPKTLALKAVLDTQVRNDGSFGGEMDYLDSPEQPKGAMSGIIK